MIRQIEMYETKGKQFVSLKSAVAYREGLIEEFIRKLPGFEDVAAKKRIAFIQAIIDQRKSLIDLLDYETSIKDDNDD